MSNSIRGHAAVNCSWHAGRPANPSACDGGSGISGTESSGGPNPRTACQPASPNAMSWGLTNEATASHGPSSPRRRQLGEQLDDLVGEDPVPDGAAVGPGGTVGLPPDPPGEPERVEPVGPAVRLDRLGDDRAVVAGGHEAVVGAGDDEVGVGDVPFAPVVGAVAAGPEPVAERRHRVRVEPRHRRVGVPLGQPVGLRDAVQGRVLPREQRGPARQARGRAGVVAVELEAAGAQRLAGRQVVAPERGERRGLVRGRVPLLVGHDDEDVGRRHQRPVPVTSAVMGGTVRDGRTDDRFGNWYSAGSGQTP